MYLFSLGGPLCIIVALATLVSRYLIRRNGVIVSAVVVRVFRDADDGGVSFRPVYSYFMNGEQFKVTYYFSFLTLSILLAPLCRSIAIIENLRRLEL